MAKRSADELAMMQSVAGVMSGLMDKVVAAARTRGLSFEDLRWLTTDVGASTLNEMIRVLAEARRPLSAPVVRSEFKAWKTIKIGTLKRVEAIRKALADGLRVSEWAEDLLGQPAFTIGKVETEIELVVASVAELGFSDRATFREICMAAEKFGLELCPAEVGPQLRLQYRDQVKDSGLLVVAMKPIGDSKGNLGLFVLNHDNEELWLDGHHGYASGLWGEAVQFVFVRRK